MYFESLRLGLQQMKLSSDGWLLFSQRIKKNEFRFVEPGKEENTTESTLSAVTT